MGASKARTALNELSSRSGNFRWLIILGLVLVALGLILVFSNLVVSSGSTNAAFGFIGLFLSGIGLAISSTFTMLWIFVKTMENHAQVVFYSAPSAITVDEEDSINKHFGNR